MYTFRRAMVLWEIAYVRYGTVVSSYLIPNPAGTATWNMSDCATWNTSGKQVECANLFHVFISCVFNVLIPPIIHVNKPRVFHVLMTPIIHVNKLRVLHLLMSPIIHVNKPRVFQVLMSPIIHLNKPRVLHWCQSEILKNYLINCLFNSPFLHFHLWHYLIWNIHEISQVKLHYYFILDPTRREPSTMTLTL